IHPECTPRTIRKHYCVTYDIYILTITLIDSYFIYQKISSLLLIYHIYKSACIPSIWKKDNNSIILISRHCQKEFMKMEDKKSVKMNVQTMYKGELLRAGKTYIVSEETAKRWIIVELRKKQLKLTIKQTKTPLSKGAFIIYKMKSRQRSAKNSSAFSRYFSSSGARSYSSTIASTGQTATHAPQSMQISGSI